MSFIIIGLLLIIFNYLIFSESYLSLLFLYILGSLIGLSAAFYFIFSNKKALITFIVLTSIAMIYSVFAFLTFSGFFLVVRIIFTEAIKYLIIFLIIFWIYRKIIKK